MKTSSREIARQGSHHTSHERARHGTSCQKKGKIKRKAPRYDRQDRKTPECRRLHENTLPAGVSVRRRCHNNGRPEKSFGIGKDRKVLFDHVNMDIKRGEKICIVGRNGIGKTTLLKIIMNQLAPDSGRVKIGHNVTFGYYDQGPDAP